MAGHVVPAEVRSTARLGYLMHQAGFLGGTNTGWARGRQLATRPTVNTQTLRIMRAWFARHGPRARGGGTSYPGYLKWMRDGSPVDPDGISRKYRGAVSWLLWGGDPAMAWVDRELRMRLEGAR